MILVRQEVNDILKDNALWIALGCVLIVALIVAAIVLYNHFRKKKIVSKKEENTVNEFYDLVGGKENIVEISLKGSRLALKLKKTDELNREAIKNLGVTNIIEAKEKITFVLSNEAKDYFSKIDTNI